MEKLVSRINEKIGDDHVMLSYNWSSQDLVLKIHDKLAKLGLKLWMDVKGGVHGSIAAAMADGVENSAVFIPFMTEEYQDSMPCNQEIEYANDLRILIMPVKAQKVSNTGKSYRARGKLGILTAGKLYIDMTDPDLFDEKVNQLIVCIGNELISPDEVVGILSEDQEETTDEEEDAIVDQRLVMELKTKVITLESINFKRIVVDVGYPVLAIGLILKKSKTACEFDLTYGFIGNQVWADEGARGEFLVTYTESNAINIKRVVQTRSLTFKMQSMGHKRKERDMCQPVKSIELIKQLSMSPCIKDVSFGYNGTVIWVDKGARGIFSVTF